MLFLQCSELGFVACLLLDLAMPEMSGLEVKQQSRARGLRIPNVFVTAHANDEVERHVLAAGVIAMLLKPVDQRATPPGARSGGRAVKMLSPAREFDVQSCFRWLHMRIGREVGGKSIRTTQTRDISCPVAAQHSCLNPPSRTPSPVVFVVDDDP